MIQIAFTEEAIAQLHYERYHHPHPRVQQRMEALLLKAKGLPHHTIADCVGVCANTLRSYFTAYQAGGIDALKQNNFYQPTSALVAHQETLETYFRHHPPATIAEAAAVIERLTGIQRKPTQVRAFLQKIGMKRLKTYSVPEKHDADAQETFKKTNSNHGSKRQKRERERSSL
jgi:transposase